MLDVHKCIQFYLFSTEQFKVFDLTAERWVRVIIDS